MGDRLRQTGRVPRRLTTHAGGRTVAVGPGLVVAQPLRVEVEDEAGYDLELDVSPQNGRLVATELVVRQRPEGPPVTLDGIRRLPIAGLLRQIGAQELNEVEERDGGLFELTTPDLTGESVAQLVAEGPTDRTLRTVAYLYRHAIAVGDPPVKVIEQTLGLSRSKAGRWIAEARRRGFLGPAEGAGRAAG